MKHVKGISKESLPAKAIFIIEIDDKAGCATIPSNEQAACRERVKAGGIYSYVIL